MTADRDFLCSCCIRREFVIVSAKTPFDDLEMDADTDAVVSYVQRLSMLDQAAMLAKLRSAHR